MIGVPSMINCGNYLPCLHGRRLPSGPRGIDHPGRLNCVRRHESRRRSPHELRGSRPPKDRLSALERSIVGLAAALAGINAKSLTTSTVDDVSIA